MEIYHFHVFDYIVFIGIILIATFFGIWYGYIKPLLMKRRAPVEEPPEPEIKKKHRFSLGSKYLKDYLLGSRKLHIFPIAMSLVGSYISGATIVGAPAEIYIYGTQYWLVLIPIILMGFTVFYVYLPVFAALRLASTYEYLELRFNSTIRVLISCMFVMDELFFLPIIVYVPAISLGQATGLDPIKVGCAVTVICVIYTYLGGIRTVVATDATQIAIMFLSCFAITILGIVYGGGLTKIFSNADEGGRVIYKNFDASPYARETVLSVMIGGYGYWTSFNAVNQTMIQRYMCLDGLASMKIAAIIFIIGILLSISMCCMCGVLLFNEFGRCDPLTTGRIETNDQLVVLYVTKVFEYKFGLPGFFIAGVFGAGISSLSVVLNSTATVIFQDICKGGFNMEFTPKSGALFLKGIIIVLGCISLALLTVVGRLGTILGVVTALTGIAAATSMGVFSLGMLVPFSTTKGAIAGIASSAIFTGWIVLGTQLMSLQGKLHPEALPMFTDGCDNTTVIHNITAPYDQSKIFPLFRLSYWWVTPIGVATTLLVGSIVSLITGHEKLVDVDPMLISPVMHWVLPADAFINYGSRKRTSKSISDSRPSTIQFVGRLPPRE